ncbi:MAG: hypothetical protein ABIY50_12480 [Ignavibacteria bacterium]
MKIFNNREIKFFLIINLFSVTFLSCNQISEGQQRKKFEFLYKLNNYSALLREYTNEINTYKDLDFYEGRMKILYSDLNGISIVKDWGKSAILKESFMKTIDDNIQTLNAFKQKQYPARENIRQEFDVITMNERVDYFMKQLNDAISEVGRE